MRRGGGWDGPPVRSVMDWPEMRTRYAWLPPHRGTTATGAHQIGVSFSAREVARRIGGQCELVWADGGQTDFYDQEKQVTMAIDAVDRHFRATLAR